MDCCCFLQPHVCPEAYSQHAPSFEKLIIGFLPPCLIHALCKIPQFYIKGPYNFLTLPRDPRSPREPGTHDIL